MEAEGKSTGMSCPAGHYACGSLPTIENALYQVLAKRKVKMIIIDEIHNILAGSNRSSTTTMLQII